jgi:hypothetical protein
MLPSRRESSDLHCTKEFKSSSVFKCTQGCNLPILKLFIDVYKMWSFAPVATVCFGSGSSTVSGVIAKHASLMPLNVRGLSFHVRDTGLKHICMKTHTRMLR